MRYKKAFNRQRELPFGEKLQNHALNSRCNHEFYKYFNDETKEVPIIIKIINQNESRYFINQKLLLIKTNDRQVFDISKTIIKIINKYIELRKKNFGKFFEECIKYSESYKGDKKGAISFIESNLSENADARIFEIVSFLICKYYYYTKKVYFGFEESNIKEYRLSLHKQEEQMLMMAVLIL